MAAVQICPQCYQTRQPWRGGPILAGRADQPRDLADVPAQGCVSTAKSPLLRSLPASTKPAAPRSLAALTASITPLQIVTSA